MRLLALVLLCLVLGGQTQWVVSTVGDTHCSATPISSSPLKFNFYCSNPRGVASGSYTASLNNLTTDTLTVGLSSQTGLGGVSCMFAVNATANPVTMGSFGSVGAGSVSWQCADTGQQVGNSVTGSKLGKGEKE